MMLKSLSATSRLLCTWALSALLFSATGNAQEAEKGSVTYNKGLTINSDDGNNSLTVNGRLQVRVEYKKNVNKHVTKISLPGARLNLKGHAIDTRYTYGVHLVLDDGQFKLQDFFGNFAVLPHDMQFKVGRFLHGYSWLELASSGSLEFNQRSSVWEIFRLGTVTGLSFHNGKSGRFNWDVGIYENGDKDVSRAAASASVSFNHNNINASSEADLEGGPFRIIGTLGGFARASVGDNHFTGYAASLGALAKCNNASFSAGAYFGVPYKGIGDLRKEDIGLAGQAQAGYVFSKRYGIAARYAIGGQLTKFDPSHEILGSGSLYIHGQDLKFQVDGGVTIAQKHVTPTIRAQFQFAF